MPVFEDWLKEPLKIIHNIYASDLSNFDLKVNEYFESKLKSEKNYYSIPSLNEVLIHELTPNCLVRYRCMIQDSANPEYFVSHHKLKHTSSNDLLHLTSKYKDVVNYPEGFELYHENNEHHHENSENLSQRLLFYCVPVPGESDWVKTKTNSFSSTVCSIASTSNCQNRPTKRGIDTADEVELMDGPQKVEETPMLTTDGVNDENSLSKRSKINESKTTSSSNSIHLNFPLQNQESGITCIVKVYDNFEAYKINDIVEFIGILSTDPTLAYCAQCSHKQKLTANDGNTMETDHEMNNYMLETYRETLNPCQCAFAPPSLVPRLHSVKSFHLKHNNPLLGNVYTDMKLSIDDQPKTYWNTQMFSLINSIAIKTCYQLSTNEARTIDSSNLHLLIKLRQEIVNYFQEYFLLGDSLAAEYLLMNLVSGIFARKDVTILGKFTLNFYNVPTHPPSDVAAMPSTDNNKKPIAENTNTYPHIFYKYFKEMLTMSHMFNLSVDTLNTSNLIPNKDYNNDKLISGMLQLPDRFQLVVDETVLNAGELKQKGLINLQGLNDIIKWQKLNYDFGFHSHEFLTNIRVLILSHTKSIVASDCQFKLNPSVASHQFKPEDYEAHLQRFHANEANAVFFSNLRKYLSIVSNLDYQLTESMQKIVEEDFVQMRHNCPANAKIGVDEFHLLLVIARLQCLSYGKHEMSLNEWNKAKYLEKDRKARLQ